MKPLSHVGLFVIQGTVAHQAPPSMEFSRQEYWSGLPFPFPGDLLGPGTERSCPALRVDVLPSEPPGQTLIIAYVEPKSSCEELPHWKRLWCWEGLGAGGEGDDREWDGWMASLTWWTWVWVNSGSWWWTGRPGLRFMGSQSRTRLSDWIEMNW